MISRLGQTYLEGDGPSDRAVAHYINSGEAEPLPFPTGRALGLAGAATAIGAGIGGFVTRSPGGAALGGAAGALFGSAGSGVALTERALLRGISGRALKDPATRELLNERLSALQQEGVDTRNPKALDGYLNRRRLDKLEREHQGWLERLR